MNFCVLVPFEFFFSFSSQSLVIRFAQNRKFESFVFSSNNNNNNKWRDKLRGEGAIIFFFVPKLTWSWFALIKCHIWKRLIFTQRYLLSVRRTQSKAIIFLHGKMESYARSIKSGSHLIYITQFHHPHHFWFKFVDTNHSDRRGLFELDTKVHEYATKRRHTVKTMAPKTGDIIAAYNIMWDKWVRGRVENVIEVENGTPRYELWAIDYGLPMSVIGIYTAPLPIELAEFNMYAVHEGCSYGIVPAEQVRLPFIKSFRYPNLPKNQQTFDVAMLGPKLTPAEKWSPEAIAMCKSIFTSAAFILFEINEEFTDNQYVFGSLRVQLFDGSIKDINKCLMDSKLIVKIKNFDSGKMNWPHDTRTKFYECRMRILN